MPRNRVAFLLPYFLLLLFIATGDDRAATQTDQTGWAVPARELVGAILARASAPPAVSLQVRNLSSLSPAEAEEIKRTLRSQFSAAGTQIVKAEQAVTEIQITLSENTSGYLWVAEAGRGDTHQIAMVRVPRAETSSMPRVTSTISLRKTQVWSQAANPLLDVALLKSDALLVLDSSTVSLYREKQSHWELEQSQPIGQSKPWPRDLRGRLAVHEHKFEAYLPGRKCSGSAEPGVQMECRESDDPWPIAAGDEKLRAFFGARNFFTGALAGTSSRGNEAPFFSAAANGESVWFTGIDGAMHGRGGARTSVSAGSDIAGVKSDCGNGFQLLVSGAGDWTRSDSIRAQELVNGEWLAAGAPVEFPGPVLALWTTNEENAATVVIRNLSNEIYEAYVLSVACR